MKHFQRGDIIIARWCNEVVRAIITRAVRLVSPNGLVISFEYYAEDMTKTIHGLPYKYIIRESDILGGCND